LQNAANVPYFGSWNVFALTDFMPSADHPDCIGGAFLLSHFDANSIFFHFPKYGGA
jgi:hypothetical protein